MRGCYWPQSHTIIASFFYPTIKNFLINYIICRTEELRNQSAEQPAQIGRENCAHDLSDNSIK